MFERDMHSSQDIGVLAWNRLERIARSVEEGR